MNLYDFEEVVNPTIVERGSEYFDAGFVAKLVRLGDGRYSALVEGADMYEVSVQLDSESNILMSYCDCPFDLGPVCKHEVAVYYELIDRLKDNDFSEATPNELPNLKTILESLSKVELIDILIDLADKDPSLHNELLFNYATVDEQQEIARFKKMIESIVEKYVGREGFITYKYIGDFLNELFVVLNKVETVKNSLVAMEIAELLLNEGIKSFQYADDSNGDIGFLLDQIIKTMDTIAHGPLEAAEQSEMLDRLIRLSKSDILEGWSDFRIDVLGIGLKFAGNVQMRQVLMDELEAMVMDSSANDYGRYENERIFNLMYDLIETFGTTEEAKRFLQDNIGYPSFRKRLMQYAMDEEKYESVLALASEGECMDRKYRGLVTRWKKWRYRAYQQLKSYSEQMKIGKELLMGGDFKYYSELKELAADESSFYDELKQELADKNDRMYVQLIETENDVDAILDYVRQYPSTIERYLKYLLDSHKDEAIRLFGSHIRENAENAFNRKQYKEVCKLLKRFRKLAGHEAQMNLAKELEQTNKNRPAFLDELSKL